MSLNNWLPPLQAQPSRPAPGQTLTHRLPNEVSLRNAEASPDMAFAKKIVRDLEKISLKLNGCAKEASNVDGALIKVYKHLNKRLEYVLHPDKLIEKEKDDGKLRTSYEQFKSSKDKKFALEEHVMQKCLSIFETTVNICKTWQKNDENSGDSNNAQHSVRNGTKNTTCWWFELAEKHENPFFDSRNKRDISKYLKATIRKLLQIGAEQSSEKTKYFRIFVKTISICMHGDVTDCTDQNIDNIFGSYFRQGNLVSDIKSKELSRKLASITFRTAVHLEKSGRSVSTYKYLFFYSSILSSMAFGRSGASENSPDRQDSNTGIVFARFQYSFAALKKALSHEATSFLPCATNNLKDLNILTSSVLSYLASDSIGNTCIYSQKVINMIIGNQARWQRTFKSTDQIDDVKEMWKAFSSSTSKCTQDGFANSSNEMKYFILYQAAEAYKFYVLDARDEYGVQNMCLHAYLCVHKIMRKCYHDQQEHSLALHSYITLVEDVEMFKDVHDENLKKQHASIEDWFCQMDDIIKSKRSSKFMLGMHDFIFAMYRSKSFSDKRALLQKAAINLLDFDVQTILDSEYSWYVLKPIVCLLQNAAAVISIYGEHGPSLQLCRQNLRFHDVACRDSHTSLYRRAILKTMSDEFLKVKLQLVETIHDLGFTAVALNCMDTVQLVTDTADQGILGILCELIKIEIALYHDHDIEKASANLDIVKKKATNTSKFSKLYGKQMFQIARICYCAGQANQALHFAKLADAFYHHRISHLRSSPEEFGLSDSDDVNIKQQQSISLSSWPIIGNYSYFLSFMDTLYQSRCLPSCSNAYLITGKDLARILQSDKWYRSYEVQQKCLTMIRCRTRLSAALANNDSEFQDFKPFHINKSSRLCLDTLDEGLCHIEYSVFFEKFERAKSEMKQVSKFISTFLKYNSTRVGTVDNNKENLYDQSWVPGKGAFAINNCPKILNVQRQQLFYEFDLYLKVDKIQQNYEFVKKIMKKCFKMCQLPMEKAMLCFFQSKMKPDLNTIEYCKTSARFVWNVSVPFITRQVLRGYVGTYHLLNKDSMPMKQKQHVGILSLLSVGLPYDMWHYNNISDKESSNMFNPTTASLKDTEEKTLLRIKSLHRVCNWEILSMYFDEHLGIVMTHIKDGVVEVNLTQISSSMFESLLHSFDDIQTRNEATLNEATNIDNKDNSAKREWWKRRYDIDADMKLLIQKLDDIIAKNFTPKSLAKKLSELSLLPEDGKADEQNSKNPIILLLGSEIQCFPWESTKSLGSMEVTRMPSIHSLLDLGEKILSLHSAGPSPYKLHNGSFIINPESNLPQTEKNFKQLMVTKGEPNQHRQLASVLSNINKKGKIKVGTKPVTSDILDLLKSSDILTYWGHDSLMKFTSSGKVAKLSRKNNCVVFDMGCNSGRLYSKGRFGAHGKVHSLIAGGCPAVVSNLWKVSTGDCDILASKILQNIAMCKKGKSLSTIVKCALDCAGSGKKIKLRHLNGSATICYGVPVVLEL